MNEIELTDWSFRRTGDRYTPTELTTLCASGKVYGHPRFEDGSRVDTSGIADADGRKLTTKSGSVYILKGAPDSEYVAFMAKEGKILDLDNPVTLVED